MSSVVILDNFQGKASRSVLRSEEQLQAEKLSQSLQLEPCSLNSTKRNSLETLFPHIMRTNQTSPTKRVNSSSTGDEDLFARGDNEGQRVQETPVKEASSGDVFFSPGLLKETDIYFSLASMQKK